MSHNGRSFDPSTKVFDEIAHNIRDIKTWSDEKFDRHFSRLLPPCMSVSLDRLKMYRDDIKEQEWAQ